MNQFFSTLWRFLRTGRLNFIHPTAVIGQNVVIWNFAVILKNAVIGDNVSIGSNSEIGAGSQIGNGARISAQVFLPSNSIVGEGAFLGPGSKCTDDRYPKSSNPYYLAEPPWIEPNASIGAGAILLPGVRVGAGALVAAGAVVSKDVAPGSMVRGERARERIDGLKSLNREHGWYN